MTLWAGMIAAVGVIVNLGWTIFWSILVRRQVQQARQDDRFADHHVRLVKLEEKVGALPSRIATHEDVQEVHLRVSEVKRTANETKSDVGELKGLLTGIRKTVDAINAALLNGAKQ
ncbi:MAG: hypothetical protein CMF68_16515 [Magnetovibrio sp.]|nr:hypothetical protein [Magnetovibrio sp.]|tara:strand:- start:702 stop:1049 length:348 start_codon:yes stop_codon:yes gene_type:complete